MQTRVLRPIGTADSADFTDFEEARLLGDDRTIFSWQNSGVSSIVTY
jgi:hypothetical protein